LIRVGISGWRYAPWRGVFYPQGLAQRRELEYCGRHFPTVEINGSFYSLQRPEYYEQWYRETPAGFVFAVKGSRYITHLLRLANIEKPLANFFASGVLALEEKLGPSCGSSRRGSASTRNASKPSSGSCRAPARRRWRSPGGATHA
jgi:uncharacterized protein YecE (DUF72 family)